MAGISRRKLGLSSRTSPISARARRTVSAQPARGSAVGDAWSFIRCSMMVRIWLANARRSEAPKLSISSATFSQSTGALLPARPAARSAAACSADHSTRSAR